MTVDKMTVDKITAGKMTVDNTLRKIDSK